MWIFSLEFSSHLHRWVPIVHKQRPPLVDRIIVKETPHQKDLDSNGEESFCIYYHYIFCLFCFSILLWCDINSMNGNYFLALISLLRRLDITQLPSPPIINSPHSYLNEGVAMLISRRTQLFFIFSKTVMDKKTERFQNDGSCEAYSPLSLVGERAATSLWWTKQTTHCWCSNINNSRRPSWRRPPVVLTRAD